jgi:hypothetical protein
MLSLKYVIAQSTAGRCHDVTMLVSCCPVLNTLLHLIDLVAAHRRPRTWRLITAKPNDNDDTSHLAALHDDEPVAVKIKGRKTRLVLDDIEKLVSALHTPLSPIWALCKALFGLSILFYGLEVIHYYIADRQWHIRLLLICSTCVGCKYSLALAA